MKNSSAERVRVRSTSASDCNKSAPQSLVACATNTPPEQELPVLAMYKGLSPVVYSPQVTGATMWQLGAVTGTSAGVALIINEYTWGQSFNITWQSAGVTYATLVDCSNPGETGNTPYQLPIVTFPAVPVEFVAVSGAYSIVVSSVDPSAEVSFQLNQQPFDKSRQSVTFSAAADAPGTSNLASVTPNPTSTAATLPDQNPIKVVISQVTPDQGEPLGNTAVLYGYYLQPNGEGLQFYVNEAQSEKCFKPGQVGIDVTIDPVNLTISISSQ